MAVTYRNIINFIADYCFAVLDAQDRLEKGLIPSSFTMEYHLWDFSEDHYFEFQNTEGTASKLLISDILDEYAGQSIDETGGNRTEHQIMTDCVCVLMPKNIVFSGTVNGSLMKIVMFEDFGELVFFYGQTYGREFAQPTIDLINKSAKRNRLRLNWDDPFIKVYDNAG